MAQSTEREQWARRSDEHRTDFAKAKSPRPLQVGACLLGVLAACVEVALGCVVAGVTPLPFLADAAWLWVVVGLAACAALTLQAQRLWKRAGARAGRKAGSVAGVLMACLGFFAWALFFLFAKNLKGSTKVLGVVAAAIPPAASALIAALV